MGLAVAPRDLPEFVALAGAIVQSERIASFVGSQR
jgi:hypothetical protein